MKRRWIGVSFNGLPDVVIEHFLKIMNKVYLAVLLALLSTLTVSVFDLTQTGQTGTAFNVMTCNAQSIIDFKFNSSSSADYGTPTAPTVVLEYLFRPIWHTATSHS